MNLLTEIPASILKRDVTIWLGRCSAIFEMVRILRGPPHWTASLEGASRDCIQCGHRPRVGYKLPSVLTTDESELVLEHPCRAAFTLSAHPKDRFYCQSATIRLQSAYGSPLPSRFRARPALCARVPARAGRLPKRWANSISWPAPTHWLAALRRNDRKLFLELLQLALAINSSWS
jgi:hypothetical protein